MHRLYLGSRLSAALASASIGNYAAISIAFITNVLLTRTIGPHEFGRLALLLMASQVAMLFVSSWTQTALVRFGAREHTAHGVVARTFWDRLLLMAPGAGLLGLIVVLFAPHLARYLAIPEAALWLVAAHVVLGMVFATGAAVLQATERMTRYGFALAFDRGAGLLFVAAAMLLGRVDAVGALVAYLAGTCVSSVWLFLSIRRLIFVRVPLDRARVAEFARFSLPIFAGTWAGLFGSQWIDLIILRQFLPLADLGLYSLSYQLSGAVQQFTIIAGALLLPRLSSLVALNDTTEIDTTFGRVIPSWLLVYGVAIGVLIGLAETIVPLVFGAEFGPAVPALWALLVAVAVASLFSVVQPLLIAHGVVWPISLAVATAVVVNVALDLVLVPPYGIVGAALATLGSYTASMVVTLATAAVRLGLRPQRYLIFLVPPVAAAASAIAFDGPGLTVAVVASSIAVGLIAVRMFDL